MPRRPRGVVVKGSLRRPMRKSIVGAGKGWKRCEYA